MTSASLATTNAYFTLFANSGSSRYFASTFVEIRDEFICADADQLARTNQVFSDNIMAIAPRDGYQAIISV